MTSIAHLTKDDPSQIQQLFMASTLHEIKNQLGQIMIAVDTLQSQAKVSNESPEAQKLAYQFQLLNFRLNQILQAYKNQEHYQLRLDDHDLDDVFQETLIRHQSNKAQVEISIETPTHLCPCFDESLIINVIDTCIYNALQAGATKIALSAHAEKTTNQGAWIQIEDNGPGFPSDFLNQPLGSTKSGELRQNKSGLGLYMAHNILLSHSTKTETGKLMLDNTSSLGGARIKLYIP